MSAEWKPGDVALVTDSYTPERGEWAASKDGKGWASLDPEIGWCSDADILTARPLVVIDPVEITGPDETAGDDPIPEIASCLMRLAERDGANATDGTYRGRVAARLSAVFEAASAPSKPPEPTGLGAVVKDDAGWLWTRCKTGDVRAWITDQTGEPWRYYNTIDAVKVLSEGVS